MRKFIINTFLFTSIAFLVYLLSFFTLKLLLTEKISESRLVILGDSHTEYLNLPNTYNYSVSGAAFIIPYNFVRVFQEEFKGKKVCIAFGYHNISGLYENRFNGSEVVEGWLQMINRELNTYNLIPTVLNYEWRKNSGISKVISKSKITRLYECNFNVKAKNSDEAKFDTTYAKKIINSHFIRGESKSDDFQLKYLDLLISLLKSLDCEIVLLSTPVTDYYMDHVPSNIRERYDRIISKYQLPYYNLNEILSDQIDSSWFKDADHMNEKGDIKVEDYISNEIL